MTSQSQFEANRENAKKGGVKSPEGKAAVSKNAITHGILSKEVIVPGESIPALNKMRMSLWEQLKPQGEVESLLVDKIAAGIWRMRRYQRYETGLFTHFKFDALEEDARREAKKFTKEDNILSCLGGPIVTIVDVETHEMAIKKAETFETLKNNENSRTAQKVTSNEGMISNLIRYESHLERGLYRALHELERLQAIRAGKTVSPPVVVDVDLSPGHVLPQAGE